MEQLVLQILAIPLLGASTRPSLATTITIVPRIRAITQPDVLSNPLLAMTTRFAQMTAATPVPDVCSLTYPAAAMITTFAPRTAVVPPQVVSTLPFLVMTRRRVRKTRVHLPPDARTC